MACSEVHLPNGLALQCGHTVTTGGYANGVRRALRGGRHWRSLPRSHTRLHSIVGGRRALLHVQVWFLRENGM